MRGATVMFMLLSTVGALAGERMNVAVCNIGELPAQVIEHAEAEAAYVFQAMDVEIHWTSCGAEVDAPDARMRPDFIVRVRAGGHISKVGPTSFKALGRAFMSVDGAGYMADVYYGAIRELTLLYPVAGSEQVMGYTIAHELGHLLGAGHRPNGLMRAALSKEELNALNQRHLKFNKAEQAAIHRKLRSRAAGSHAAPINDVAKMLPSASKIAGTSPWPRPY